MTQKTCFSLICSFTIFFKDLLFFLIWECSGEGERHTDIFHLLVYFPGCCMARAGPGYYQEPGSSAYLPTWLGNCFYAVFLTPLSGTRWEVGQPWNELVLTRDDGGIKVTASPTVPQRWCLFPLVSFYILVLCMWRCLCLSFLFGGVFTHRNGITLSMWFVNLPFYLSSLKKIQYFVFLGFFFIT